MITFELLVFDFHEMCLQIRSMENFLNSVDFKKTFSVSSETEKEQVQTLVNDLQFEKLKEWFENQRKLSLDTMSLRDLRKLGQKLKVKHYAQITKSMLRDAIIFKRKITNEEIRIDTNHFSSTRRDEGVNIGSGGK